MKTFIEMLEGVYSSDYKVKEFVGKDGKTHTRKSHPRRIVDDDESKKDEMKEETQIFEDIKAEYDSLKKNHDIKSLRGLIKTQHKIIDTSEFKTKDHAISHYLRTKHGDKKVAAAFGLKEAHKIGDTVVMTKGPKDVVGKTGQVGEIRTAAGGAKTYTIDHDKGSVQLKSTHFKKHSEDKMKTFKNHITHNMPTNEEVELTIEEQLHEVLSKDAKAADWIADFVKSDNPKFEGKSKKERVKMALGAYYGQQKESYNDNRTGFGRREREDDEYHVPDPTPVAPTLHRKYIKGTPEHKAHKALHKPINGHPTGKYNEEVEEIEENHLMDYRRYTQAAKNASSKGDHDIAKDAAAKAQKSAEHYTRLTGKKPTFNEEVVDESAVPDHMKGKQKPYVSSDGKGNYEVLGNTGQTKAEFTRKEHGTNAQSKAREHLKSKYNDYMKEEVEHIEEGINGREYASHGLMHPDHAKMNLHQVSKDHVDFYATKTGDKMHGKVTKNDGKSVHIQAHKELGDGKLHKFKVTPHLPKQNNEQFENGELETTMKSYKEFMENLEEALWPGTPEYNKKFGGGAKREVGAETKTAHGKAIGTGTGVKHERDYEKAEKETPAPASTEKRGRGRPAGSTSGARQKGTIAKSEYAGADYTGHKLHLPNSNR